MNKEALEEIILNINARTGIRNEILEKDYYVCLILKELSVKQKELQAYFKSITNELLKSFNKMQKIYVLDEESKITINEAKKALKKLNYIFKEIEEEYRLNVI